MLNVTGKNFAGMDRQGRKEKKNKTVGTERSENIDSLYINKIIIFVAINNLILHFSWSKFECSSLDWFSLKHISSSSSLL
jgi:hypothetical protein